MLVQRVCCVCVHKKRGVRKEGSQLGVVRSGEKIKGRKSESKRKYSPPPYSSLSYSPYTQLQPPGKEKKVQCFAAWNKSGCRVVAKCTAIPLPALLLPSELEWSEAESLYCIAAYFTFCMTHKRRDCWNRVSFCLTHTKWVDWYTMTIVVSQLYRDFFPQFPSWDICYQKLLFYR